MISPLATSAAIAQRGREKSSRDAIAAENKFVRKTIFAPAYHQPFFY
jgi:hypothetical protein